MKQSNKTAYLVILLAVIVGVSQRRCPVAHTVGKRPAAFPACAFFCDAGLSTIGIGVMGVERFITGIREGAHMGVRGDFCQHL